MRCQLKRALVELCWGDDEFGEVTIPAGIGTVTRIAVGEWHTCAIKTDGTPVCWGRDAPIGPQPKLPAGIGTVSEISAGEYHSCAIRTDQTLTCWGSPVSGQLGGSPTFTSGSPPSLVGVGPFSHTYTAKPAPTPAGELVARFFLSSGSFPPGLALDETTGLLSGTPTADGTYTGVVSVTNDVFAPAAQAFSITVDTTAPAAPSGLASSPASPSPDLKPRILGAAEPGSAVRLYGNETCSGSPRATGSAAAFASPGLQITVAVDSTTTVFATATDAAGNASGCSTAKATYVNEDGLIGDPVWPHVDPDPGRRVCTVPRLAGKTLARAKRALAAAGCRLGYFTGPRPSKRARHRVMVVRSSSPRAGAQAADGEVDLKVRWKHNR